MIVRLQNKPVVMAMKLLASMMLKANPVNLEVLTYRLSSELAITIIENMRPIRV